MSGLLTNGLPTRTSAQLTGSELIPIDTGLSQGQSPQSAAVSLSQLLGFAGLPTTGLTAHAGGTQAAALPIATGFTRVDTVGSAADSIALPLGTPGAVCVVINNAAANSMQVFGSGTDTINGVATATGVAQAAGKTAIYYCSGAAPAAAWFRLLSA